ncbi:MAG: rod shape-determining protein MreD [Chloroflexi bacterium]|nr:rod shape-determining protein MreD [Chloroflexota bacterium]
MRIALAIVLPLLAALLQGTLAPFIAIGPARPNLPLLLAGSWSVAAGASEAVWWAFIGGLGADLLSGGPLGAFAAAGLAPVAAIGLGERSSARSTPVLAAVGLIGVATLAASLAYVALLALVGQPLPPLPALLLDSVAGAVYTAALAVIAYPLARALRGATEQESPF